MAPPLRPKLGYVTSRYPLMSHTFIQREVLGLRAAGFDVATFSIVQVDESDIVSAIDRAEAESTVNIRPVGLRHLLRHLIKPALTHPGTTLALLRLAGRRWWSDPKQLLWRVFYVGEGIMLWSLAADLNIEHLHAHHANVAADAARLASEFGKRIGSGPSSWSFTMHGSTEFTDIERHDLDAKAASAHGVACISDFTRSQVMMVTAPRHWPSYRVVHCGVDTDVFVPSHREHDPDTFTVLFVGRLAPEKGLPIIVEALGEVQRTIAPRTVNFVIVGAGPLRADVAKRCAELGIQAEFAGAVGGDEILAHYHRADALCLPSFREGIPVSLMEAMACEVPCVATRITAISELIEDGVTGLTATAGRTDLIAEQLLRYATDPELARRIGTAARERIQDGFTADRAVAEMADFFDSMFAERRADLT